MKKNKPAKVEGVKTKRMLPFKLNDQEKARKAEAAARLNEKLAEAKDKKKNEVAKHTAGIKELETKISNHLVCIAGGIERREVVCLEVKNFDDSRVEYHFEGEVLEHRPMKDADRQIVMNTKAAAKVKEVNQELARRAARRRPTLPYKDDTAEENALEIARIHKLETSRATASSAVDTKS